MGLSISLFSLALSALLIFISNRLFIRKKIIDQINNRSSHKVTATRSGGIAIYTSIFIITFLNYITENTLFDYSLLVPLGLLVSIGLYDDIFNIDFKLKFIFQVIAAKIIVDTGLLIDNFHGVFGLFEINRALAQIFTILVIISIINAINFIDGIDGLAISIFSFFIICFEFFSFQGNTLTNLSIITISSIIPLYFFNFKKENKVFLGDSGSHFLGGVISIYVIFILSQDFRILPQYDLHKILLFFSILSYPIIDIIRIVLLRLIKKKSPFKADKNHLHHILNDKFKNHFITTFVIVISSVCFCLFIQLIF